MHITFSPIRSDAALSVSRSGDVLIVNGETFDFGPLDDGSELPAEAIDSDWFCGPVKREGGELHLCLMLPHGPNAPQETLFPEPVEVSGDGPVTLPPHDATEDEA